MNENVKAGADITNKYQDVILPYEPGLVEWLVEHYPHSKYHIVEVKQ